MALIGCFWPKNLLLRQIKALLQGKAIKGMQYK
jgi:hypothetical protein